MFWQYIVLLVKIRTKRGGNIDIYVLSSRREQQLPFELSRGFVDFIFANFHSINVAVSAGSPTTWFWTRMWCWSTLTCWSRRASTTSLYFIQVVLWIRIFLPFESKLAFYIFRPGKQIKLNNLHQITY